MEFFKKNKDKLFALLLFLITTGLLMIRSQYGSAMKDEPFVVSMAQRLFQGDSLYIDEWNFAQNIGVLLLPLYRLYVGIFQTTEGILLAFRLVYCVLWGLTCIAVYSVLRKRYPGALVIFLYLAMFSPLDQMTLSYTSIGLMCCLLVATLFVRHLQVKPMDWRWFTACFSALSIVGVLASPYMAIVYVCALAGSVILYFKKRDEQSKYFLKVFLVSTLIAAVTVVLYLWRFVLNNYTIGEFIEKFHYMFSVQSPDYADPVMKILRYPVQIIHMWKRYLLILAVCFALMLIPKLRRSPRWKLGIFAVASAAYVLELLLLALQATAPMFNYQVAPIVFLGLLAFVMLDDPKAHLPMFCAYIVLGGIYSVVSYYSSDTGLMAISMGLLVPGVASIAFFCLLGKELTAHFRNEDKKTLLSRAVAAAFVLVCLCQIGVHGYIKMTRNYWDATLPNLTETISIGSAKGLKTTAIEKDSYEGRIRSLFRLLENVDMTQKDRVFFLSKVGAPDAYLDAGLPMGVFSTWITSKHEGYVEQRMDTYYRVHPDKIPNVVFCYVDDQKNVRVDLDFSGYTVFTDGDYRLLVAPEYVR